MGFRMTNNIPKFITMLRQNNNSALNNIGEFCVDKMNSYVAVDTGYLKSRNAYDIIDKTVRLKNDADYAGYQEFGTRKMKSHPFIRPSIYNHIAEIQNITGRNLKNGIG